MRIRTLSRAAAAIVACTLVPVWAARAQIAGTSHDLSSGGTNTYRGASAQTCIYCHTPHAGGSSGAPLWNRSLQATGFTMYASPTMQGTVGTVPGAVSRACLSCHDGVGTPAIYNGVSGASHPITGTANIGVDLSNDHPVAITVPATYPDADIKARSTWSATLPLFGAGADQLECSTCHEPHNRGAAGAGHFLRASNAGSALCTTCHNK